MNLLDIYRGDPGAFGAGMDAFDLEQRQKKANLEQTNLANMFSQQNDPLRLQQQRLQNQTIEKQLPGVEAQSSLLTGQAKMAQDTQQFRLDDFIKEHESKMSQRDLDNITKAAQAYTQAGSYLTDAPGGANHDLARRMLGRFYRPEFDQISPGALGQVLSMFGRNMSDADAKFRHRMAEIDKQKQYDLEKAQLQEKGKADRAAAAASIKAQAGDNPSKESAALASTRYYKLMFQATDENERQAFREQAEFYAKLAQVMGPQPANPLTLSPEATGGALTPRLPPPIPTPPAIDRKGSISTVPPQPQRGLSGSVGTTTINPQKIIDAFGKYDPNNYEYAVMPDGTPIRRAKNKDK